MTAVQAAVVAFGSNLCSRLAGHIKVQGAFYVLLATLAAAVYYDYSTLWYCTGFALLTGAAPQLLCTTLDPARCIAPTSVVGTSPRAPAATATALPSIGSVHN